MTSYGKFKNFEIRDQTKLTVGSCKEFAENSIIIGEQVQNAMTTGEYDLVVWLEENHCISIGTLIYKDDHFVFESVGLRFLEYSTPELNKWLLKWCELKELELEDE